MMNDEIYKLCKREVKYFRNLRNLKTHTVHHYYLIELNSYWLRTYTYIFSKSLDIVSMDMVRALNSLVMHFEHYSWAAELVCHTKWRTSHYCCLWMAGSFSRALFTSNHRIINYYQLTSLHVECSKSIA